MPSSISEVIKMVDSSISAILISAAGGVAHHFYEVSKGKTFRFATFFINVVLAGWLGYVVSWLVQYDSVMFGPMLSITGFCTYPFLRLLEEKAPEIWSRVFIKR